MGQNIGSTWCVQSRSAYLAQFLALVSFFLLLFSSSSFFQLDDWKLLLVWKESTGSLGAFSLGLPIWLISFFWVRWKKCVAGAERKYRLIRYYWVFNLDLLTELSFFVSVTFSENLRYFSFKTKLSDSRSVYITFAFKSIWNHHLFALKQLAQTQDYFIISSEKLK